MSRPSPARRLAYPALALVVLAWAPPGATAQRPYEEIRLSAGAVETVNRVLVHEWWRPATGGLFVLQTPFDVGYLELGGRIDTYRGRPADLPDFDAVFAFGGWGLAWSPRPWIRMSGGVRAGMLVMRFDDPDDPWNRTESEMTLAAAVRVEVMPVRAIGIYAETGRSRTFTYRRIDLEQATAGLVVRLSSPGWLRGILE